jgi:hypothetical protein
MYDATLDEVGVRRDLVVLDLGKDAEPYSAANRVILEQAVALGPVSGEPVSAALVWDGLPGRDFNFHNSLNPRRCHQCLWFGDEQS